MRWAASAWAAVMAKTAEAACNISEVKDADWLTSEIPREANNAATSGEGSDPSTAKTPALPTLHVLSSPC